MTFSIVTGTSFGSEREAHPLEAAFLGQAGGDVGDRVAPDRRCALTARNPRSNGFSMRKKPRSCRMVDVDDAQVAAAQQPA